MEDFTNRRSQFINRRRFSIVSQTPNEMVVDVFRNEGEVFSEGSAIDATTMNNFNSGCETAISASANAMDKATLAESTANTAKTAADAAGVTATAAVNTSNEAKIAADNALRISGEARTNATSAASTATQAKTTAESALGKSNEALSTATAAENLAHSKCEVNVNNVAQTGINFTDDPQAQIDSKASQSALEAETAAREALATNLSEQLGTKADQTGLNAEISARQNADNLINAKFTNFVSGVAEIADGAGTVIVSTGLSEINSFSPTLFVNSANPLNRHLTISNIDGGNVTLQLRDGSTGEVAGISNAVELGMKIYWFATKNIV